MTASRSSFVGQAVIRRRMGTGRCFRRLPLNHQHLTLQDADAVGAAVASFRKRPALGFSQCLVLQVSRNAGHIPLGTFDRNLAKLDDVERL